MCGIVGLVAGDTAVDERALHLMTGALAARGPDGEGFHVEPSVGLGHRRLAIIDVAGGRQPLYGEDRQVVAVVNGELYNFVSLRAELQQAGHTFATRSDSEVVVHGYEEWGDTVVERLEGMFALAVWDARRRRLLLARDRIGEKPLFFAALPHGAFAFASELKALAFAPGLDRRVDPASLARYLVYEYVPSPASMVHGVSKLEPGTCLVVEPGKTPVSTRYWDLPLGDGDRITDLDSAAEMLITELRRAVRERLVSDVPLGVFLSGGIDSSAVAALAAEVRGGELETFSIGFEDKSFDESPAARRVAKAIGSRHFEERLAPARLLELLPDIGRLLDEPIGDGSIVPTYLLARFARRRVTVALGGDGADELFAGYPTFQAERIAALLFDRAPAVGRAFAWAGAGALRVLPPSHGYLSPTFQLQQFLKGAGGSGPRRHQSWMSSFTPADAVAAVADQAGEALEGDVYDVIDRRMAECRAKDPWDRLLYHYVKGYLGNDVLTKVDRASMAVGLESRAPMLDTRVIELACRVHPSLRLKRFHTKHVLKRALRGLLPAETLRRKKHGFAMPIGAWLKGPLRPLLEETLSERRLRDTGLLEPVPVRRLVEDHLNDRADHRKQLWTLIAFVRWLDEWQKLT
jgi:asparagine synthase (glutamine-hydrolysing)